MGNRMLRNRDRILSAIGSRRIRSRRPEQAKGARQATARLAKLALPPPETPLELRILVARALVAADDKRARPYVLSFAKPLLKHPDLNEAALELKP